MNSTILRVAFVIIFRDGHRIDDFVYVQHDFSVIYHKVLAFFRLVPREIDDRFIMQHNKEVVTVDGSIISPVSLDNLNANRQKHAFVIAIDDGRGELR